MDSHTKQHLKEWESYRKRLVNDLPKAEGIWINFLEYRIQALECLITRYSE